MAREAAGGEGLERVGLAGGTVKSGAGEAHGFRNRQVDSLVK